MDEARAGAKGLIGVGQSLAGLVGKVSLSESVGQALPGSDTATETTQVEQTLKQHLQAQADWPPRVAKEVLDAVATITGQDEANAAGLKIDTSGDPPGPEGKPNDEQPPPANETPPGDQPTPDGPVSITGPNGQKMQLNPDQVKNAKAIVEEGKKLGVSKKGIEIALMTALDEGKLQNYGSVKFPQSQQYADKNPDGTPILGSDHNSIGIFQQQVGIWGDDIPNMMDPHTAADRFFKGYVHPDGKTNAGLSSVNYESMTPWAAAQAVQGSFDSSGSNYKQWWQGAEDLAGQLGVG
ncbi:hypothetical protein [Segniliparus rotundus]|uniref:hypothetical protein n=1 Tax=Segniliparus rotundus TaxID=286802 RepID=UPI0011D14944|nr:hypothetical protein [Segniliparus rotundus]